MRGFDREDGASNVIEYSIVLPLCLIAVCFVIVVGFYLHQCAVLEAATYRAALVVQRIYNDPNAMDLIDFGEDDGLQVGYRSKAELKGMPLHRDPYRYFNKNYRAGEIKQTVEAKIEEIISKESLAPVRAKYTESLAPDYQGMSGFVCKTATISVTQSFKLPGIFRIVGLPQNTQLHAEVIAPVISQTEFIRNSMFVEDIIEELSGTSETVGKLTGTIQGFFSKISGFFKQK